MTITTDYIVDTDGIVHFRAGGYPLVAGCNTCTHRTGPTTCTAFPKGIPSEYQEWRSPHLVSDGHDGGITYVPARQAITAGDLPGHDFHGNQYRDGESGPTITPYSPHQLQTTKLSEFDSKMQAKILSKAEEKLGVSYEEGRSNLASLLDAAAGTPAWEEGMHWYENQSNDAARIGADHGGIPQKNVAAAFAAMSPGTYWDYERPIVEAMATYQGEKVPLNISEERLAGLNAALDRKGLDPVSNGDRLDRMDPMTATLSMKRQFDEDGRGSWGVSYGYLNYQKALESLRGADPNETLGGVKVRSFYNNLADPTDSRDVTIDVQMVQAYAADPTIKNGSGVMGVPSFKDTEIGPTPVISDAIRELAAERNILPQQAQAIMWVEWRNQFTRGEKR